MLDTICNLKYGSHKIKLSKAFKLDVEWWLEFLHTSNGVVYYRECERYVVHTDACLQGAGMFCGGDRAYSNWNLDEPQYTNLHINYKEVMAVVLAAKWWGSRWANSNVTVITDSVVAKAVINKGTCHSPLDVSTT